jgi:GNAT superfamily N-acetyltransferase
MKNLRIVIEPHADEKLRQFVRDNLGIYSLVATGQEEYYSVSLFLRGESDEVLGGVLGEIWGQWMFVSHVWLAAPLRRSGYGRRLLLTAEQYAKAKGCQNVWLTTHSFQARPFYEKLGYQMFAQLDEFPPGHKLHFMRKRLAMDGDAVIEKPRTRKKSAPRSPS